MRRAILLNRQGFPALQPYIEKNRCVVAQPGCDNFPCISCTAIDAPGIKCCGNFLRRPMRLGFERFIRLFIGQKLMHRTGALNYARIAGSLLNEGAINKMSPKNHAGK
jgi:hypothetical protein